MMHTPLRRVAAALALGGLLAVSSATASATTAPEPQAPPAEPTTSFVIAEGDVTQQLTSDGDPYLGDASLGDPTLIAPTKLEPAPSTIAEDPRLADPSQLQAIVIPYTKGSVFWYSTVYYSGRLYTVGNIRYSWSHMWTIKNKMGTAAGLGTAMCGYIPNRIAKSACIAAVQGAYYTIKKIINSSITNRKCLKMRFPLPPLVGYMTIGLWQVTCTA